MAPFLIDMSELPQNGFTQEQLVIYKLGQIESQLAALLVKLTDNNIQINKDLLELKEDVIADRKRLKMLEDQYSTARNRVIGAVIIISAIIAISKDLVITWLKSFLPH